MQALPSHRARAPAGGVLDLDVGVALLVEPHEVAAVVAHVEPAQQRLAEPRVGHRGALVPERSGSIQTQADRRIFSIISSPRL